jgi:FixJ family two-component response regulator
MARFEGGTVLMSGHLEFLLNHDDEFGAKAMREGAVAFFSKPFDHQLLLTTLRATVDSTRDAGSLPFAIAS